MIAVRVTQRRVPVNPIALIQSLAGIMDAAGFYGWDVGLWVTSDATIRRLNAEHRGKSKATDILSFANLAFTEGQLRSPAPQENAQDWNNNHSQHDAVLDAMLHDSNDLGDLVVSAPFVERYCRRHHLSVKEHWPVLLAHGICHLLGYDHESDEQYHRMAKQEEQLLARWPERCPSAPAIQASLEEAEDNELVRAMQARPLTPRRRQRYCWEWPLSSTSAR